MPNERRPLPFGCGKTEMEFSAKNALIPGSFDPITLGHLDVIIRASGIFDRVTVAVLANAEKHTMFTVDERLAMVSLAIEDEGLKNVGAVSWDGLTSDAASAFGAATLVKGARGCVDFDYELMLASVMRDFDARLDSVILPARPELAHISSTYAREVIRYGGELSRALPAAVASFVEKLHRK